MAKTWPWNITPSGADHTLHAGTRTFAFLNVTAKQPTQMLTEAERRMYFLLKLIIFFYPVPNEEEMDELRSTAQNWHADEDRKWAIAFVEQAPSTAFVRAKAYVQDALAPLSDAERASALSNVWNAQDGLPHVTEMQGMALMRLVEGLGLDDAMLRLLGRR